MKIRIACVTCEEVAKSYRSATLRLEKFLAEYFCGRDYGGGIDQFMAVAVSVDSDEGENDRFCRDNTRVGSYKSMESGNRIKYVSVALGMDPESSRFFSEAELAQGISRKLADEIQGAISIIPKGFDFDRFSHDLRLCLGEFSSHGT